MWLHYSPSLTILKRAKERSWRPNIKAFSNETKSTYSSRLPCRLAWFGVWVALLGYLGHSYSTPNPSRAHACSEQSKLLLWVLTGMVLIVLEGGRQQVGRTELVCTNSISCRRQHLDDCLDYPKRGEKKRKGNSIALKRWTSKPNQMFHIVKVSIFL